MSKFVGNSGAEWVYDEGRRIGDPGGMGEVFEGTSSCGLAVAVKRVRLRLGDEGERRRRARELEIADRLLVGGTAGTPTDHLLVPLDYGFLGDDMLIVMPRAQESLNGALQRGDLDVSARLGAVRQVAVGLMQLSQLGILHRDLKPANVLRIGERWLLADFGIARDLFESTATYTFFGAGTLPYMAPELWQGQPATPKSDLYALGILGYEVLTGKRPFDGPGEADYRRQHVYEAAPEVKGVDSAIARLLLRLIRKDPNGRPQDARAVVEALDIHRPSLDVDQQRLLTAALDSERRSTQAEAERSIAAAEQRSVVDLRHQALSELEALMKDAEDRARVALPAVNLRIEGNVFELFWHNFPGVMIELWLSPPTQVVPNDTLVHAGQVYLAQGRPSTAELRTDGNVICELRDGRLQWSLLRFTVSPLVGDRYELGPLDRPHGFGLDQFARERVHMINRALHVWQLQQRQLTAQVMVELLSEAIERDEV